MTRISPSELQHLADNGFVVVDNFLTAELQRDLIEDVKELRSNSKFKVAKIGHDGMVQDDDAPYRDIRFSETCFIGSKNEPDSSMSSSSFLAARQKLYQVLNQLRSDLGVGNSDILQAEGAQTRGLPDKLDDDLEELMYAYYPRGGYYRRHRDAEPGSISSIRKYSLLLYLNKDWKQQNGGHLRLHRDSGGDELPTNELPNFIDVEPRGGTLVLFRSDLVPHEVLDTHVERIAIVGWLLSSLATNGSNVVIRNENGPSSKSSTATATPVSASIPEMNSETLSALRALREAIPRLAQKFQSSPPVDHSGMLGDDDFFFTTTNAPPKKKQEIPSPNCNDTDLSYWAPIAAWNSQGRVTTLSLAGQRLRKIDSQLLLKPALLQHLVTLDLGNTDLPVAILVDCLRQCNHLRQLHLGGNALTGNDMKLILGEEGENSNLLLGLRTLDLRYNNVGPSGASMLTSFLTRENCCCEVVYLEGNQLGDDGAVALANGTGSLLELYLGQNDIGPDGSSALAKGLTSGRLKKLYMEGNRMGPEGARAFRVVLEGMGQNKRLEKLYCDNNSIGKEEAMKLGKALQSVTMVGDAAFFSD